METPLSLCPSPPFVWRASEREREALPEFDRISGAEEACPSVRVRPSGGCAELNDFEAASFLPAAVTRAAEVSCALGYNWRFYCVILAWADEMQSNFTVHLYKFHTVAKKPKRDVERESIPPARVIAGLCSRA